MSGMHLVCCAIFLDVSDIGMMTEFIRCQGESIQRVVISYLDSFYHSIGERVKLINRGLFYFSRKWFSILCVLQVNNIRRNWVGRKVVHTFIKSHMFGNLDHMGFGGIPCDILIGVGCET